METSFFESLTEEQQEAAREWTFDPYDVEMDATRIANEIFGSDWEDDLQGYNCLKAIFEKDPSEYNEYLLNQRINFMVDKYVSKLEP